jgi:hypothetical protein
MRKLIIHLEKFEKINNKIQNVLSFDVKDEKEALDILSMHEGNVKKYQIGTPKI